MTLGKTGRGVCSKGCLALASSGTAAPRGSRHRGPCLVPRSLLSPAPGLGPGWFYGERLRDGETGWFPEDLARSITSRVAVEGNMRRMERLRVETDV